MGETWIPGLGQAVAPIVFVTGIGQTWSTLRDDTKHRWNLFPDDKEVLFRDYPKGGKRRLARLAAQAAVRCVTGLPVLRKKSIDTAMQDLFRWCTVDQSGKLPDRVEVRIYGARSFDKLAHVDFETGAYTDRFDASLLARIYKDIPCGSLADSFGAQNLYCFNYSTFSDIYADADALHRMLEEVIADQRDKTGAKKVILVPMSMGATVVSAYLDKYYTDTGSIGENLVEKVVSIVGAWDGSDGLADLLACNGGEGWRTRFYGDFLPAMLGDKQWLLHLLRKKATDDTLRQLLDGALDNLLLNTSAFLALLPLARFDALAEKLFSPARMQRLPRIRAVRAEADAYHAAQQNLRHRLYAIRENCGVGFYFLCGYGMLFGNGGSDFDFLKLFDSAEKTNSDTVIQVSSTAPGTSFVKPGERFADSAGRRLSPDGSVDAATAWFPETSWYFAGQEHELGHNTTALKLAIDIALGKVADVHTPYYPQFNESRDVRPAMAALEKAQALLAAPQLSAEEKRTLAQRADAVETMLACTVNRRKEDDDTVHKLLAQLETLQH